MVQETVVMITRTIGTGWSGRLVRCLAALMIWLAATPAAAQDVQRIAAIINDDMVSEYDVEMRLNLVLSATGASSNPEERRRLRQQILQGLVDEKLQVQEAIDKEISLEADEIDDGITRLGNQNSLTRQQFEDFLVSIQSGIATIRTRVEAELMWTELVGRQLASRLSISDSEVQGVLDRMQADAGKPEYDIGEIFLIVESPDQEAEVKKTADRLVSQIRNGASFAALANQFSDGATAAVGGNVGWVPEAQLLPEIAEILQAMRQGRITPPIRTAGGFYIIFLQNRRKILTVDPMEVELDLKQISLAISKDALPEEIAALRAMAEERTSALESCADVESMGAAMGAASAGPLGKLKLGELPQGIQNAVDGIEIGKATRSIIRGNTIRLFIVCGRDEPEVRLPSFDDIENRLTQSRLALMARRYLRDLRRDAIVDYK